jgi:acetyl esterase/lipase
MNESLQARAARIVVRSVLKPALRPAVSVRLQRAWVAAATRTLSVPYRRVRIERATLDGVPTEILRPRGDAVAAGASAVLFLHGGAFLLGSPTSHRSITARLALLTGATVYAVDYRLAPEHPFPAAHADAFAGYRALLAQGLEPGRIAVAGDSAGGGLALSLALRAVRDGLPRPACLALISPWVDMTLARLADVPGDSLLSPGWLRQGANAYLRGRDAGTAAASPLFGDLSTLPPTLIQSVSEEILREDARRLAEAAKAASTPVEHQEFEGLWHDFQLYAGVVPEATRAVAAVARFVVERCSGTYDSGNQTHIEFAPRLFQR